MNTQPARKERKPLHPLAGVGFALFATGLLAWLWLNEWRWAVTGLVAMLVLVVASAVTANRREHG